MIGEGDRRRRCDACAGELACQAPLAISDGAGLLEAGDQKLGGRVYFDYAARCYHLRWE